MKSLVHQKFWKRVRKEAGCWLWTGELNSMGYGRLSFGSQKHGKRQRVLAHRLSLELHGVEVPADAVVMHTCDNPICVNPEHLIVATQLDNIRDMHAKRRGNHGERNGMSKLTEEQVLAIREMLAAGKSNREIADLFGRTPHNIRMIKTGVRWGKVS